jgi:hypothetical protein
MPELHAEGVGHLPPLLLRSHFCNGLVHLNVSTQQFHTGLLLGFNYCRIGSRELNSRKVHRGISLPQTSHMGLHSSKEGLLSTAQGLLSGYLGVMREEAALSLLRLLLLLLLV